MGVTCHDGAMNAQELVTVLVPVVTGIVGALGIMFQGWYARRSRAEQRRLAFEDAIRQVTFAEQWWKARTAMDPAPVAVEYATTTALVQVDSAHNFVGALKDSQGTPDSRSVFRKLFLLYGFQRRVAKVLRVLYFLLLAFMYLIALALVGNLLAGATQYTTRDSLVSQLMASILIGSVALVLRSVAYSIEDGADPNR